MSVKSSLLPDGLELLERACKDAGISFRSLLAATCKAFVAQNSYRFVEGGPTLGPYNRLKMPGESSFVTFSVDDSDRALSESG